MIKDRADEVKEVVVDGLKPIQAQIDAQSTFEWAIPDVERLKRTFPKGDRPLKSPDFILQGVPFHLQYFPCGRASTPAGKCLLLLYSSDNNHQSKVFLSVNDGPRHLLEEGDSWNEGWGFHLWPIPSASGDSDTVRIKATMVSTKRFAKHVWDGN